MDVSIICFFVIVSGLLFIQILALFVSPSSDDHLKLLRKLSRRRNKDQINAELICAKIEYYRAKTKALEGKE